MTDSQSPGDKAKIDTSPLGHPFTRRELATQCGAIYGAVALPGQRSGFAVVVCRDQSLLLRHRPHKVYLLDEFESPDMRILIRQCSALDFKYRPTEWVGDWKNSAAAQFIEEMNSEKESADNKLRYDDNDNILTRRIRHSARTRGRRTFSLTWTFILDMVHPYVYILPELKQLLAEDRRQLVLKDSSVLNYMSQIEQDEIASMEFGEYPAIEALAFAVLEIRQDDDYDADTGEEQKPVDPMDWI